MTRFFLACAILMIASSDARAVTFADSAQVDGSYNASIASLSDSAGGTSETDNKRTTYGQNGGTVSLIFVTYGFPKTRLSAGSHNAYFVVDQNVKGSVAARVTAINGTTVSGTFSTSISATKVQDQYFPISFSLSQATDLTTLGFLIVLADANEKANLDLDAVAIPEPATWLLFGIGAVGLGAWNCRRRKRRPA